MFTALDTTQVKLLAEISRFASHSVLTSEQEQQLGSLLSSFLERGGGGQWGLYQEVGTDYRWCSWFPSHPELPQMLDAQADSPRFELEDEKRLYGVLTCQEFPATEEAEAMLVLLKNLLTIILRMQATPPTQITERFFELLFTNASTSELPRLASYLGCPLQEPHSVIRIELPPSSAESLAPMMQKLSPAPLYTFASQGKKCLLTCLTQLNLATSQSIFVKWVEDVFFELQNRFKSSIFIGVSDPCQELHLYPQAYMQAEIALSVCHMNNPRTGGVELHTDVGIYQTFSAFPIGAQIQPYPFQAEIMSIARHDEEKKTEYLRTLEAYLQLGGNTLATAKVFGKKHSQTIDDRLSLISERFLSGRVNVKKDTERWPLLRLAIASYRLQQLDRE